MTTLFTSSGGGSLLWKWNETDVSQFGATILTPSAGSASLSKQDTPGGPVIRITTTADCAGRAMFPVSALNLAAYRRYRIRFAVSNLQNFGANNRADVSFCNGASGSGVGGFFGYTLDFGTGTQFIRDSGAGAPLGNGGATGISGVPTTAENRRLFCDGLLTQKQQSVTSETDVSLDWTIKGEAAGSTLAGNSLLGSDLTGGDPPTWLAKTNRVISTIAIGIFFAAAPGLVATIDISELQVFLHPMDLAS